MFVSDFSSLDFFVRLFIALDKTGTINIKVKDSGDLFLDYSTSNWDTILNIWIPYFNQVQGNKYYSFKAIVRIYELNKLKDVNSIKENILLGCFKKFSLISQFLVCKSVDSPFTGWFRSHIDDFI